MKDLQTIRRQIEEFSTPTEGGKRSVSLHTPHPDKKVDSLRKKALKSHMEWLSFEWKQKQTSLGMSQSDIKKSKALGDKAEDLYKSFIGLATQYSEKNDKQGVDEATKRSASEKAQKLAKKAVALQVSARNFLWNGGGVETRKWETFHDRYEKITESPYWEEARNILGWYEGITLGDLAA